MSNDWQTNRALSTEALALNGETVTLHLVNGETATGTLAVEPGEARDFTITESGGTVWTTRAEYVCAISHTPA